MARKLLLLAGCLAARASAAVSAAGSPPVVLVTGATGQTGALLYKALKEQGATVRGFVRNATKAREVLGCSKCDESEGIFVGDVTQQESLAAAMQGITSLAILTSATCTPTGGDDESCTYHKGAFPIDVDWHGGKAQIKAFGEATRGSLGPVVLCASMGTTEPDNYLDKMGNGHVSFYGLNMEAALMASGLPFTIVKPCTLADDPAQQTELVVGHDDEVQEDPDTISRGDVARVMAEALMRPNQAARLRFDLCSRAGPATADLSKVFEAARYPWQKPAAGDKLVV